jgi:hypothetical protein
VCGSPAFDHALFDDLSYAHGRIGGKAYVPDVSSNMDLRYDLWNRLKLEINLPTGIRGNCVLQAERVDLAGHPHC